MAHHIKEKLSQIDELKKEIISYIKSSIEEVDTFPASAKIISKTPLVFTMPMSSLSKKDSWSISTITGNSQKKYVLEKIDSAKSVEAIVSFLEKCVADKKVAGEKINDSLLSKLEEVLADCK